MCCDYLPRRALGLSVSLDTNYDPLETWDGGLHEAPPISISSAQPG